MKKKYVFLLVVGVCVIAVAILVVVFWRSHSKISSPVTDPNVAYASSTDVDLNGDGTIDKVTITITDEPDHSRRLATLSINDVSTSSYISADGVLADYLGIVDIDTHDNIKEIALSDDTASAPSVTNFYRYDGKNIVSIGTLQGIYQQMKFDGDGTVTNVVDGKLLDDGSFHHEDHELSPSHQLVDMPKSFYERLGDSQVIAIARLPLQKSPTDPTIITTLEKGDVVNILGCDDVAWCEVENEQKIDGWFMVQGFDKIPAVNLSPLQVFYGLYYALDRTAPSPVPEEFPKISDRYATTTQDLNGDGKADVITLRLVENDYQAVAELNINGDTIELRGDGGSPDDSFGIVDIDTRDNLKEIAINKLGPNGSAGTNFYAYDGKNIIEVGGIPGNWEQGITFDSKGALTTFARAHILDTWGYKDEYQLSSAHKLVRVPKSFYERGDSSPIIMLRSFSLQRSPTDPTTAVVLQKGDFVTILGCDDIKWCKVQDKEGVQGWFAVHNFNVIIGPEVPAGEIFYGLSNAG